jgi:pilus assembly protein Flp/PilA
MGAIIRRFLADRSGATAVEYGLIIAVLSLTIVAGVNSASNSLQNLWGHVATTVDETTN